MNCVLMRTPRTRFSISSFVVLDLLFLALVCDLKLEAGKSGKERRIGF